MQQFRDGQEPTRFVISSADKIEIGRNLVEARAYIRDRIEIRSQLRRLFCYSTAILAGLVGIWEIIATPDKASGLRRMAEGVELGITALAALGAIYTVSSYEERSRSSDNEEYGCLDEALDVLNDLEEAE